jgi:dUTP pyrophosphatase
MELKTLKVERMSATAKLPTRAHPNDAGLDLYADETKLLSPGEHTYIKTGIKIAFPKGYVVLVWDKGGLATKGIHTIGGVFDTDYRGEYLINIVNLSQTAQNIEQGQKICQLLVQKIELPEIEETIIDDQTPRGEGRFGSTGLY